MPTKNKFLMIACMAIILLPSFATATPTTLIYASHGSATNTATDAITSPSGTVIAIAPHPAWYTMAGVPWISTAVTGDPSAPGYTVFPNGTEIDFDQIFVIPTNFSISSAKLDFLADDTAGGVLNGNTLFGPFLTPGPACAPGAPGCLASTQLSMSITPGLFNPGVNHFVSTPRQISGYSFGEAYELSITGSYVPEPSTSVLMAFGLTLVFISRKMILRRRIPIKES